MTAVKRLVLIHSILMNLKAVKKMKSVKVESLSLPLRFLNMSKNNKNFPMKPADAEVEEDLNQDSKMFQSLKKKQSKSMSMMAKK